MCNFDRVKVVNPPVRIYACFTNSMHTTNLSAPQAEIFGLWGLYYHSETSRSARKCLEVSIFLHPHGKSAPPNWGCTIWLTAGYGGSSEIRGCKIWGCRIFPRKFGGAEPPWTPKIWGCRTSLLAKNPPLQKKLVHPRFFAAGRRDCFALNQNVIKTIRNQIGALLPLSPIVFQ